MTKVSDNNAFVSSLLEWYPNHKRELPWRDTNNPYHIWLSEIILQQTRVAQGLSYYQKFTAAYPTVFDLANAPEDEVLRLWQGLGYYSRARNLHAAAKSVVHDKDGVFPENYDGLLKLKGVGKYTAAAIASFAYGEAKAVVDGNVYRVLARVFGISNDISSTEGIKIFAEKAQELIPADHAATYNQAIMEFGAIQCTPKQAKCLICPLQNICVARKSDLVDQLPVKLKKTKTRNRFFNYIVIENNGLYTLNKRPSGDIWTGLFEFPLLETESEQEDISQIIDELNQRFGVHLQQFHSVASVPKHVLSHQKIHSKFWRFKLDDLNAQLTSTSFYDIEKIEDLPKPVLINNYLKAHIF